MAEEQNGQRPIDFELIKSTNELLQRAGDRAVADRLAEQQRREQHRPAFEEAARQGEWVPAWVKMPAAQLSNQEIVAEARTTHQQFQSLSQEYAGASEGRRAELREEIQPLVDRARDLRQEYSARTQPELRQDQAIDQQISLGR